ncbi:MAG: tetratricopeptide repeat protein [Phycisphaeraceae bacterium]|nr:tetratricopeptide repeat protein [Phycisphaeraceae bacterium]
MKFGEPRSPRDEAQELVYSAMESGDERKAAKFCRRALEIYPDCVDALSLLADLECDVLKDYVPAKRKAVEAGRRDLGEDYIQRMKGEFWLDIDTRPYMRALAGLADALLQWGQPEHIDEAIGIYEQMLELNPNDNQGVRDPLAACYLQRMRYHDAAELLKRYEDDWMAVASWARVLLAYATGDEDEAAMLLKEAREQNPHVELYLTGKKRRPRTRPGSYSPGEDTEAVFCADTLWEAWKKHPEAKRWVKERCAAEKVGGEALPTSDDQLDVGEDSAPEESLLFPIESDGPGRNDLTALKGEVPEAYRDRFDAIAERTDAFCDRHLNDEYKQLAREMATSICQKGSPVLKGKPEGWAAGVIHALGQVNFLTDPSQAPHMKSEEIAKSIGVSPATMQAKAKIIREGLELMPFHPDWSLPSRLDDNPLVWMLVVDGMVVDIRTAPREAQVAAYEEGLIPYIPADRDES